MTGVALLVIGTVGVALGATAGARLLHLERPLDRLLAAFVLAWAQIVVTSILVGAMLHRYERLPLLLANLAWDAVLVGAAARFAPVATGRSALRAAGAAVRELSLWQRVIVAAAALALLWRLVLAVVLPPFAYDALSYHLTAVAAWIQSGRIGLNPYAVCCSGYPANAETLAGWPTLLLGHDRLADTVQVGSTLLAALAVAGLARLARLSPAGSLTAAGLFLLTPIVLTQSNTAYDDVTITAAFLAGLYFAARLVEGAGRPRPAFALLGGLAAGLALGTKANGIVLAAAIAVPVAAGLAAATVRRRSARAWAGAAGLFLSSAVVLGGWWYVHDWVDTGNPLWPIDISVLGRPLFSGTVSYHDTLTVAPGAPRGPIFSIARSWYQDLVFWTRSDYSYEERSGGLGPLWSWLGWPLVILAAVEALRRRRSLAVSVLLPAALAFVVLPYGWWSRFTIYLAALGAVAIAGTLERSRVPAVRRTLAAGAVGLALAGGALATWRLDPAGNGHTLTAVRVLRLAAHPERRRSVGTLFFDEFAWLRHVPATATIGVDYDAPQIRFLYPLFGSTLKRHVVLLLPGDEGRIDSRLAERPAAYLFVARPGAFDRWARARPRLYRLVAAARGTEVFLRTATAP